MRLILTRSENIALTTITIHPLLLFLCRLLPVRLAGSIMTSLEFYSYRLIGKLTAFLQLQEFSQHNQIWEHSSTFARGFPFDAEFTCFFDSCQSNGFTYYSKSGRGAYHHVNFLVLVCSLSSHRHSCTHLIFSSRFIDS
jgi:hypothetical protein